MFVLDGIFCMYTIIKVPIRGSLRENLAKLRILLARLGFRDLRNADKN